MVVLLCTSLGLKAWTSSHAADQTGRVPDMSTLFGPGFALSQETGLDAPSWIASRGDCRIEVASVSALGWHQSAMAARAGEQALAYVYQGRVYSEQPVLLTKLGYYWHKLTSYFIPSSQPPVFAVVTSRGCAGQSIDATLIAHHLP